MKTLSTFLLVILGISLLTSCNKGPDCGNWYDEDGDECVEMREKFVGTWIGERTSPSGPSNFSSPDTFVIATGPQINELLFVNRGNLVGQLTSSTEFIYNTPDTSSVQAERTGVLSNETITILTYIVSPNNPEDKSLLHSFTGQKQ